MWLPVLAPQLFIETPSLPLSSFYFLGRFVSRGKEESMHVGVLGGGFVCSGNDSQSAFCSHGLVVGQEGERRGCLCRQAESLLELHADDGAGL